MCLTTSLKPLSFASAMNEGETSSAIIIVNRMDVRMRRNNRVIALPPLRSAEIEREIFRDSELAAQVIDLFGVERADDVDDHDPFRVGDQHADPFDHGVVVDHQEDLDVLAVALAAHAGDAIPAGRGELSANRFDVGLGVSALLIELHAFDINALERLNDLFDRGLIRLVASQKFGRYLQQRAVNPDVNRLDSLRK